MLFTRFRTVAAVVVACGTAFAGLSPWGAGVNAQSTRIAAPAAPSDLGTYWVQVNSGAGIDVLTAEYDVLETREGDEVQVIADLATVSQLRRRGYVVRPLEVVASAQSTPQVQRFYSGYRSVAEHEAHLSQVAAAYPGLAVVHDVGDSWKKTQGLGGYDIQVMCITKLQPGDCQMSPNSTKPRTVIMAAIHARELATSELAWRLIDELTASYDINADITALLNSTEVWVLPVANPDGRVITEAGGNSPYLQRKNANNSVGNCANPRQ